ncbi:MAG: ribonuclease III [Burkholderiaceae bacterium]|jgi:ribonuclease-3
MKNLSILENALNHRFADQALLGQALTHRSFGALHNERLEFLGDSILNFVVSKMLFEHFVDENEGRLSRIRSHLVKQECLAGIAHNLNISVFVRLGDGEIKTGGASRPSILADTLEALWGAVLVDGGFSCAQQSILHLIRPLLANLSPEALGKDAKTRLQEYMQGAKRALPSYIVEVEGGAVQSPQFRVRCTIDDFTAIGHGASRRAAEQQAAAQMLGFFETISVGFLK